MKKDKESIKAEKAKIREEKLRLKEESKAKNSIGSEKKSPQKLAKKFAHELPDIAKRHSIRVSSPYGYYPEDVDTIILQLEKSVSDLEKENKKLSEELNDTKNKSALLQTEISQIKMQVSLMEFPDVSAEEGFAMLSKVSTITGKQETANSAIASLLNDEDDIYKEPKVTNPIRVNIKPVIDKNNNVPDGEQPTTYANLIRPKKN